MVVGVCHALLAERSQILAVFSHTPTAEDMKTLPAYRQGTEFCLGSQDIEASHACCCGGWEQIFPPGVGIVEMDKNSVWILGTLKA